MNIQEATASYEAWMHRCALIVDKELRDKHFKMKRNPFEFFRGTYYRWAELWPKACNKSNRSPVVLSVGDLHIDSYGTWRDVEGRMCWGVDDFDESWPLPYTNDLTRLAASVKIARKLEILSIRTKHACEIILKAYNRTLRQGGCPIVLAEEEAHLEKLGIEFLKPASSFWEKLIARPSIRGHKADTQVEKHYLGHPAVCPLRLSPVLPVFRFFPFFPFFPFLPFFRRAFRGK